VTSVTFASDARIVLSSFPALASSSRPMAERTGAGTATDVSHIRAAPARATGPVSTPALTMPADTFKVGSLVHLEKDGRRATYFVDHGRTPDEIVLKRVTSTPPVPDA